MQLHIRKTKRSFSEFLTSSILVTSLLQHNILIFETTISEVGAAKAVTRGGGHVVRQVKTRIP